MINNDRIVLVYRTINGLPLLVELLLLLIDGVVVVDVLLFSWLMVASANLYIKLVDKGWSLLWLAPSDENDDCDDDVVVGIQIFVIQW